MFWRKMKKKSVPYLDFTRRVLVGGSLLNIDQHPQFTDLLDWSRTVWKSLLADPGLR